MSFGTRLGLGASYFILGVAAIYLLLPIVIVLLVSFSPSFVFDLPTSEFSLRWYRKVWGLEPFWEAFLNSLGLALASSAIAMVLGVLAAVGLVFGRFPGREAISVFLVSPLMLPGLVFGVAVLHSLRAIGVYGAFTGLLIAHIVITMPFVARAALASLTLFDFTLIDAARMLGLSMPRAILKVLVPNIAPGVLAGALFAFVASFDNYATSIFLTDARVKTLPIQMLNFLDESPDPSLAAMSAVMIVMTLAVLFICDRIVGVRRLASM
jgi:putative spermidine/putrescine transport system permease protein